MKILTIVVVAVLAGIGIGFAATVAEFGFSPPEPKLIGPDSNRAGPQGKLVMDETTYESGNMLMHEKGEHKFVFRNEGRGAVDLKPGDASCKCTGVLVSRKHVPPGEQSEITLRWDTGRAIGVFDHGVPVVMTNNDVSWVRLSIKGKVFPDFKFNPGVVWVRTLSPHEKSTHQVKLFFFRDADVQIVRQQFSNEAIADFFDVRYEPLSPEEVALEEAAKCGYLITASIKDGLPIGTLHQNVTLTTSRETDPPVVLNFTGSVQPDVALVAYNQAWQDTSQTVTFGEIKQALGDSVDLSLQINGKYQFSTEVKIAEVVPPLLNVTLGERTTLGNKVTDRIPLKIEVPPGTEICNHLGGDGQEEGRIVITTSHPLYPELVIHVKFAVVE